MIEFLTTYRSFSKPSRMLMINQFAINTGFFMLMPYLAGYMAGPLGLAAWAVGLVLGIRNFSQQGMFLVGGTLADRLGYKPLIVAGCLLRTGGFALLAFADSLPALLIASAATGFAGALFNPAVRAYLAVDSADRRVEAFAMFNIFYQAGILFGPVVGLALMAFDFRATAAGSAIVFALLTLAQLRALPQHEAEQKTASVLDDWRVVVANRPFLLFSAAMIGCYVLSFQVYLALPMQATRVVGAEAAATLMTAVFVVSGLIAIAGQLRITRWFAARWGRPQSLVLGMGILAAAFVPLLLVPGTGLGTPVAVGAMLVTAAVLGVGAAAVFPFEMDTVVALCGDRLVATHYGLYNTIVGVGILLGNLGTGTILDAARAAGVSSLAWAGLIAIGALSAGGLALLARSGRLDAPVPVG
ncbi:MFS transporter [Nocardia cyriacigeorgica]|uniref:MFS transporter n=2 Tax=Nocardia cyriacigeorgica TaxID=135487 RepID=UPI000CEA5E0D|nr:MFS transporter [Nocardia cyriacigeorgica]AVH20224.1 MFS transporter [Nocardia cyriacigeorgica]MBF6089160.1 MFS transporter [Nocardia cyriacigeorgica]MBF6095783.1 MFS transporter [Nocardia cyriacigeorgica]MBF6398021.1 MFS transporter [Nocardia cyriacigeorgica]MBF6404465.1 MFS transporter [Nocardia cyriacigeorgica]